MLSCMISGLDSFKLQPMQLGIAWLLAFAGNGRIFFKVSQTFAFRSGKVLDDRHENNANNWATVYEQTIPYRHAIFQRLHSKFVLYTSCYVLYILSCWRLLNSLACLFWYLKPYGSRVPLLGREQAAVTLSRHSP